MSVQAAPAPGDGLALTIRGRSYPVVLPKLRDPRLQLAATITSLQVIGQVGFHFQVSIAQILIALGTCAVLEIAIAVWRQHVLLWPASALLTGNGVAFVLRVPGTAHGDWWSVRGWWIFAATAAVALLSKHVLVWRGRHLFNPSNIGLVICFLALGRTRAAPLDFWWGPMSTWLAVALGVILVGGFTILSRLSLLRVAVAFWISFAAAIAILAAAGHAMTARWHLGPVSGVHFWAVLVTSPEVLVFLFFMITDPKTAPSGARPRVVYAVSLGLLAALLIAPTTTEFASKVALLGALAIVCLAMPVVRRVHVPRLAIPIALAAYAGLLVAVTTSAPASHLSTVSAHDLPSIRLASSNGVQSQLDMATARVIATAFVRALPVSDDPLRVSLRPGTDQGPPIAVVERDGKTYLLHQQGAGWALGSDTAPARVEVAPPSPAAGVVTLRNVAAASGIDFRQGSFRFGVSNEPKAMMGGGVCWIDYNGDGWLDLFAVNSYANADTAQWEAHGGLPRTALFENVHGRFRNVSRAAHADLAVQGDGCVAADLDGDGRTDLAVTTSTGVDLLWNERGGTFRETSLPGTGWYTGAAVADVNGDGRPDLFVAGYADPNDPVPGSFAGFPTNVAGVRDLLFLSRGRRSFREAGVEAGLESVLPRHGLGATFTDVNGDGRPDLYVANDEDPNDLYVNVAWPGGAKADPTGLGFRFEERAATEHVADPFAGMGVATADAGARLFVTNSRNEPSAAFVRHGSSFADGRQPFERALGSGFAGWGASFVDLTNSGTPSLVLTAGAIPVTKLAADAEPVRVLQQVGARYVNGAPPASGLNGRGLAAADVGNDGRMEVAINTIGGNLVLLRPVGASGHWLDVKLSRFAPGTVVTAVLPGGRQVVGDVHAGGSYLSSEDPRVHLGLGGATRIASLVLRFPGGVTTHLHDVRADRILTVHVPSRVTRSSRATASTCTAASLHGRSLATYWNEAAVAILRTSGLSAPVQARDLYDLALAMQAASGQGPRSISLAAYRLLVWRASFGSNLQRSFSLLTARLRARCLSPDEPSSIAERAIAAGARDGSLESSHYVDPSFVPANAPLALTRAGSTARDASFWQPLALGEVAAHGLDPIPAQVQRFAASQWGRVRGRVGLDPGPSPLGVPSDPAYKRAAVAVIRATANRTPTAGIATPLAWNRIADTLPSRGLARDLELQVELNRALNDTAIAVWRAKRKYDAPRPISMIRYLAFQGQSSDRSARDYSAEGLPLVRGLIELRGSTVMVRSQGRWVRGDRWLPPVSTPPSPGWVSERTAFAAAATTVLHALTGRSFSVGASTVALGIDTPEAARAGRSLGRTIAER